MTWVSVFMMIISHHKSFGVWWQQRVQCNSTCQECEVRIFFYFADVIQSHVLWQSTGWRTGTTRSYKLINMNFVPKQQSSHIFPEGERKVSRLVNKREIVQNTSNTLFEVSEYYHHFKEQKSCCKVFWKRTSELTSCSGGKNLAATCEFHQRGWSPNMHPKYL